ncbi:hypothetical protein [Streptomyces sp. NPDC002553]|uniref:hypothetical protein n=1 Tax=Streptomyces sp. NPDC002553 TaxID=3154417 RepID=UPI00331ECF02
MSRTLLRGAHVITITPHRPAAEHVDILVDGETIAAVGETIEAPRLRAGAGHAARRMHTSGPSPTSPDLID